jgi:hypothetical protein
MDKYRRLEDYAVLHAGCALKQRLNTEKGIRFSPGLPFGSPLKDVKGAVGVFAYHEIAHPDIRCIRLFCETKLGGYKTHLMLHFFEERLFLFSYDFSELSSVDRDKIVGILKDKYLCPDSDFRGKIIADERNNVICLDDMLGLRINYMALDSDFFRFSREKVKADEHQRQEEERVKVEELYERL